MNTPRADDAPETQKRVMCKSTRKRSQISNKTLSTTVTFKTLSITLTFWSAMPSLASQAVRGCFKSDVKTCFFVIFRLRWVNNTYSRLGKGWGGEKVAEVGGLSKTLLQGWLLAVALLHGGRLRDGQHYNIYNNPRYRSVPFILLALPYSQRLPKWRAHPQIYVQMVACAYDLQAYKKSKK